MCALLALRMFAPAKIIMVEPLAYRRELALACGADHAFDPADPALTKEVLRLTGGYGADYVVVNISTGGFESSRFGPTFPVDPAAASVWQPPQPAEAKTASPAASAR